MECRYTECRRRAERDVTTESRKQSSQMTGELCNDSAGRKKQKGKKKIQQLIGKFFNKEKYHKKVKK